MPGTHTWRAPITNGHVALGKLCWSIRMQNMLLTTTHCINIHTNKNGKCSVHNSSSALQATQKSTRYVLVKITLRCPFPMKDYYLNVAWSLFGFTDYPLYAKFFCHWVWNQRCFNPFAMEIFSDFLHACRGTDFFRLVLDVFKRSNYSRIKTIIGSLRFHENVLQAERQINQELV